MATDFIKIVSESDFDYEVIAYSNQVPVIVDFWAEWCRPCKAITPILEKMAVESKGSFRLAKVNVDENPNLALRFNVRSIPNVKAFQDGRIVSEFLGLQPEPRIKEFIHNLAPSQSDLLLGKGQSLLENFKWTEAANTFRQFINKSPNNPAGLLGLIKADIMLGNYHEAKTLIADFPPSPEYAAIQLLQPLYDALARPRTTGEQFENPLEAAYLTSINLVARGYLPAAMDGFLDILRQDKLFHQGEVRKVLIGIFTLLGDNHHLTQQYRKELALVLF